jgi:hypothetical protein
VLSGSSKSAAIQALYTCLPLRLPVLTCKLPSSDLHKEEVSVDKFGIPSGARLARRESLSNIVEIIESFRFQPIVDCYSRLRRLARVLAVFHTKSED